MAFAIGMERASINALHRFSTPSRTNILRTTQPAARAPIKKTLRTGPCVAIASALSKVRSGLTLERMPRSMAPIIAPIRVQTQCSTIAKARKCRGEIWTPSQTSRDFCFTSPAMSACPSAAASPSRRKALLTTWLCRRWPGAAGSYNAITGYIIYRSNSSTTGYTQLTTVSTSATSGTLTVDSSSTLGETYYYKVATIGVRNTTGMSSQYASLLTLAFTSATAPSNIQVTPLLVIPGGTATLSWNNGLDGVNNPISNYSIKRSEAINGTYVEIARQMENALTIQGASEQGKKYYYRVQSIGTEPGFDSENSTVYAILTTATAPSAPSVSLDKSVYKSTDSAIISFSGATDLDGDITHYKLGMFTGTNGELDGDLFGNITSSPQTLSLGSYSRGSNYFIKAKTFDAMGLSSPWSGGAQLGIGAIPSLPSNFTVSPEIYVEKEVTLTWLPSSADPATITNYTIEYANSMSAAVPTKGWALVIDNGASGMTTDVGLSDTQGEYTHYRIKATSSVGDVSPHAHIYTKRNSPASAPDIISSGTTYNVQPYIVVTQNEDGDGHLQTLELSIDGEAWFEAPEVYKIPTPMTLGSHTIKARSIDEMGEISPESSATFTIEEKTFSEPIIADETRVKAFHIDELRSSVDEARAFYNLAPFEWMDVLVALETRLAFWDEHITEIHSAIDEIRFFLELQPFIWPNVPEDMRPHANITNNIREKISLL